MNLIIAGSRNFTDYSLLKKECDKFIAENNFSVTEIFSGKAPGADTLGERYAKENGIFVRDFPADWDRFKKGAGHIRNRDMARNAHALIAFWDGKSPGTHSMITLAEVNLLEIKIIRFS